MYKPTVETIRTIKNIIHYISTFIGWSFVAFGIGAMAAVLFGYYLLPPMPCITIAFIGILIMVIGQKNSELTLVEYLIAIAIIGILFPISA